jgi:uncharacterized protein
MLRFLVILAALFLVYLIVRKMLTKPASPKRPNAVQDVRKVVRCEHCGLHVPENEAVIADGRRYCSQEHARLGPP